MEDLKQGAILTTCYAAGLRVSEAVALKPSNIDSQRMVLRVELGKGQKDRYVMLSPRLLETLRGYWRVARPKQWLFPGSSPERPLTTDAVEKACLEARRRSGIAKPITPHSLRHAFAVHLLEYGNRHPHHSTAAGPSQPGYYGALPADLLHHQPPGLAASSRWRCTPARPARTVLNGGPWTVRSWKWRIFSAAMAQPIASSMALRCPPRNGVS